MRVRVKLFATLVRYLADATAGIPFELEVLEGTTVADVVNQLKLPREEVKLTFINGRACPMDRPLEADDELGIFPPIGGG